MTEEQIRQVLTQPFHKSRYNEYVQVYIHFYHRKPTICNSNCNAADVFNAITNQARASKIVSI